MRKAAQYTKAVVFFKIPTNFVCTEMYFLLYKIIWYCTVEMQLFIIIIIKYFN